MHVEPPLRENTTHIMHLTYDMGIGGTEQVICQLIAGLDAERYQCSIACIEDAVGRLGEKLQANGIAIKLLHRQPGFDTGLIKRLRQLIKSNQVNVLHCHQYTPFVYGVLAALGTPVKVVFTEHGRFFPDRYSWKRRLVNPALGWCTNHITAISKATADALAHFEWFRRASIQVVYNGIQPSVRDQLRSRRAQLQIADDAVVFGTITRFDPVKNLPLLVQAFEQVCANRSDALLLLVGDGEQRAEIEQQVGRAGLSDKVIFTGYRTDTAELMSAIDVFVLPSLSEGTSMTLLEAMSQQVCCIVSDVGGNIEIVRHAETGLVIPSGDCAALVAAMMQVLTDSALRAELAEQGGSRFRQQFELNNMVQAYDAIYQAVR